MGSAYGVIMSSEDNNAHYEERLCEDGETRTFLVTEGIIWNVIEDGAEIFHRDLVKGQSMELYEKSIDGYEDVPQNDEKSLMKAVAHQPVSVAIEAGGREFQLYE